MRRWNGWGDETVAPALPEAAGRFLAAELGEPSPPRDATLAEALGSVARSRLPEDASYTTDAEARLRHARGQSLPDWVALRSGRLERFPDAVAFPESAADVRDLLRLSRRRGVRLVPYGGGTSVVGHLTPPKGDAPVLTVSLARLSRLTALDRESRLATFGAGVLGPELEAQLRPHGLTLGHFPQSFEHSTLGGWVVTRSSGQQSMAYGRIERLFAGGRLESPEGTLVLPAFPASAAGPDLRELVLGSEGRLGILTEAVVRASALPEEDRVLAFFFPDWERGRAATREMAQEGLPLSMLRLSNVVETRTTLLLAGGERLIRLLTRWLSLRGAGDERCLLLAGVTGSASLARFGARAATAVARRHRGVGGPRAIGEAWSKNRFRAPYLRNALWERGWAVDTLETAATWDRIPALVEAVEGALRGALGAAGERVHAYTHLSHCYPSGSSAYTTYLFRAATSPEETLERWRLLKGAASEAIVRGGGTISHQHGVGVDHAPYLPREKGELGMKALGSVAAAFDPDGLMNPGKLLA